MRCWLGILASALAAVAAAFAQESSNAALSDPDLNKRVQAVRKLGEMPGGPSEVALLAPLVQDEIEEVRGAVVVALIKMRLIEAQPYLIEATADLSPRVQALAVDGLVDFYVPEYANLGRMDSVQSFASALKGRFSKPTPLTVPAYVRVRSEVINAFAEVLVHGRSEQARANAARAIGIVKGHEAVEALLVGVRSRSPSVIFESVVALKKIEDPSVGRHLVFLLRDLDPVLQQAVIQTVGQLRTSEAVDELVRIIHETNRDRIREAALIALAKIPDNGQRELFISFFRHKDGALRAAAAEGLGRIGTSDDLEVLAQLLASEKALRARLSIAFAAVMLGDHVKLAVLVDGLGSRVHRLEARPLIVEAARNPEVLQQLYVPMSTGSAPQRRHLAFVVSQSGTEESLPYLEELCDDDNKDVATAAVEALRVLRASL